MRRKPWKWALRGVLVLLAIVVLLVAWGMIEPRILLDERHERAAIPNLPVPWHGQRVALIADLQVGMWLDNQAMVHRAVRRIVDERPAAALIAGDFIYHPTEEDSNREARAELEAEDLRVIEDLIDRAVELVRPLTAAGIPTYAVLGNHDYTIETKHALAFPWVAERLTRRLEAVGVHVLRNDVVALAAPTSAGSPQDVLYLAGIDSRWAGRDEAARTLARVPDGAARIVIMHHPDTFRAMPPHQAPLALAGHTHGGQIRLPFAPSWSWLELRMREGAHADGWITDPGFGHAGNRLYVNVGLGFSTLPIRINCPPELTWFTLSAL